MILLILITCLLVDILTSGEVVKTETLSKEINHGFLLFSFNSLYIN